jgi:predicted SnoaL-like aldol condensation-catalyzing enzyme
MRRLRAQLTAVVVTLMVATMQPLVPAYAQRPECQTFAETNKQVCEVFLTYWRGNGGLAQQGYPLTGEFKEVSEVDGKAYTVQYFERAVFELHPENQHPYNVLLSLLGTMRYEQKYPGGARELPPDPGSAAGLTFPETGKEIRGEFLDYWQKNGGLAQQGYPITNRIMEKSELDGKEYVVQYFERAVFELHPENQSPHNVLLSQLGRLRFQGKYSGGEPGRTNIPLGEWGGDRIAIVTHDTGATIQYDCAHGSIDEPIVVNNDTGRFDVRGTHVYEHGGPIRQDEPPNDHPARYTGVISGNVMTMTVTTTDENKTIGTYTAYLGKQSRIHKCL